MEIVIYSIILVLVLLNSYATYCCVRSPYADKEQKIYQIIFVWVIPLGGAITVIHFSRPEKPTLKKIGNDGHDSIHVGNTTGGSVNSD